MATLSQNITQAINDFGSIKTAIQSKGVTVASGTPTADYADLIENIPAGDATSFIAMVQRSPLSVIIPDDTTSIGNYAFYKYSNLQAITIPNSVTSIGEYAFFGCNHLSNFSIPRSITTIGDFAFQTSTSSNFTSLTIPNSITTLGQKVFAQCTHLETVTIEHGFTTIGRDMFWYCTELQNLTIPNTITSINNVGNPFDGCGNLENVALENGFNCNRLNLSPSTKYSTATIIGWLNALADRTGLTAYTLTIGSTNLAKLTADQIAIATNKNWNLA